MVAKGGHPLLAPEAVDTLKRRLLPLATVLTPNLPEAEALCGAPIRDLPTMRQAAEWLLTLGVPAVLLKGGHLPGDTVTDLLATPEGVHAFQSPRIATRHTHGTGCTLASAIAAGLAQGPAAGGGRRPCPRLCAGRPARRPRLRRRPWAPSTTA